MEASRGLQLFISTYRFSTVVVELDFHVIDIHVLATHKQFLLISFGTLFVCHAKKDIF